MFAVLDSMVLQPGNYYVYSITSEMEYGLKVNYLCTKISPISRIQSEDQCAYIPLVK